MTKAQLIKALEDFSDWAQVRLVRPAPGGHDIFSLEVSNNGTLPAQVDGTPNLYLTTNQLIGRVD